MCERNTSFGHPKARSQSRQFNHTQEGLNPPSYAIIYRPRLVVLVLEAMANWFPHKDTLITGLCGTHLFSINNHYRNSFLPRVTANYSPEISSLLVIGGYLAMLTQREQETHDREPSVQP